MATKGDYAMDSSSSHDDSCSGEDTTDTQLEALENGNRDMNETKVIARQETKTVFKLKLAVVFVMVVSAIGAAIAVYQFTHQTEMDQFTSQFRRDAVKVFEAMGRSVDQTLGAFDILTVNMVSYARFANESWPFVTMPDYALRASKLLRLSNVLLINVLPLVSPAQRKEWEAYAAQNDYWVNQSMALQEEWGGYHGPAIYNWSANPSIHEAFGDLPFNTTRDYLPAWQTFPTIPHFPPYNYDFLSDSQPEALYNSLKRRAVVSHARMIPIEGDPDAQAEIESWAAFLSDYISEGDEAIAPAADFYYPIVDQVDRIDLSDVNDDNVDVSERTVGLIAATFYWRDLINAPSDSNGVVVVFQNPCNRDFTYQINKGSTVTYLGPGDLHDTSYDHLVESKSLPDLLRSFSSSGSPYTGVPLDDEFCPYTLSLYPSDDMKGDFTSHRPITYTIGAVCVFAFASLVFYLFDAAVERRQKIVMRTATHTSKIVSSLFPSEVRDRLFVNEATPEPRSGGRMSTFLLNDKNNGATASANAAYQKPAGSPIAELYPDTTVFFADISGFTAWSSSRSPTQVFELLESLYCAFDEIARARGVFKVETIGDSYVAVVGLPTPRKHHAVVMSRFAQDCLDKMRVVTKDLETSLGPGTADLALRVGLNSGPTTAGVLRGEKSRFQLFGDTVNTASRMESNGEKNRIQVSQKTADLLEQAGKGHWLTERSDKIVAKGKGAMQTYWCCPKSSGDASSSAMSLCDSDSPDQEDSPDGAEQQHLSVEWIVKVFQGLLQDVKRVQDESTVVADLESPIYGRPRDELTDALSLSSDRVAQSNATATPPLDAAVSNELWVYIKEIANRYRSNPFHNMEHCSHVVMSTLKLLHQFSGPRGKKSKRALQIDPLTRLAIVFAALIHDVDHAGVSNAQLVLEGTAEAKTYAGQSVAEQNSITTAWTLLMEDSRFAHLRACIYSNEDELKQFRQIVVNMVLATDLFDKDLQTMRNAQWEDIFGEHATCATGQADDKRATIILQLIIQASDVSHTMQHFTVYKKWNMRLLEEMYQAYTSGRAEKDPTIGWYDGELWFFDNYVIPLALKLQRCGDFGVSADEFLDYAKDNRFEWERNGRAIVAEAQDRLRGGADISASPSRLEL